MSDFTSKDVTDERNRFQHQIILTFDRLKMHAIEIEKNFIDQEIVEQISQIIDILILTFAEESSTIDVSNRSVMNVVVAADIFSFSSNIIYDRVLTANKKNTKCFKYRKIINENRTALKSINIIDCTIKKSVLYRDDQL